MPGFVTQDAHALGVAAAFDLKHLFLFQLHQARVREVERDADTRHAVGAEPFAGQPAVRAEVGESAAVEFAVEPLHAALERGRALE